MELKNTPTLVSERLILRRFQAQDTAAILRIFSDAKTNVFLPRFLIHTEEEAKRLYEENFAPKYQRARGYVYAICMKTDDIPIGYIIAGLHGAHDFGYALRSDFWHQGIASEAGQTLIERLKEDHVPFITATHDIHNSRSGAVMKRLGMRYGYSYVERWQPKDILVTFRMYQLNLDGQNDRVYRGYWESYPDHFIEDLETS